MANDIFELLAEDHRHVEALLDAIAQESDLQECLSLLNDLSLALVPHMRAEEQILYPRIKREANGRALEEDAEEQHAVAEELLGELVGMALSGEGSIDVFNEKLGQLQMAIQEHVTMEENEMFALGREVFNDEQLASLGVEIEDAKLEVQGAIEQIATGATFEPRPGAEGTQPSA